MHVSHSLEQPVGETITFDQFRAVDIRVGTIVAVEPFPEARRPAYSALRSERSSLMPGLENALDRFFTQRELAIHLRPILVGRQDVEHRKP